MMGSSSVPVEAAVANTVGYTKGSGQTGKVEAFAGASNQDDMTGMVEQWIACAKNARHIG